MILRNGVKLGVALRLVTLFSCSLFALAVNNGPSELRRTKSLSALPSHSPRFNSGDFKPVIGPAGVARPTSDRPRPIDGLIHAQLQVMQRQQVRHLAGLDAETARLRADTLARSASIFDPARTAEDHRQHLANMAGLETLSARASENRATALTRQGVLRGQRAALGLPARLPRAGSAPPRLGPPDHDRSSLFWDRALQERMESLNALRLGDRQRAMGGRTAGRLARGEGLDASDILDPGAYGAGHLLMLGDLRRDYNQRDGSRRERTQPKQDSGSG